MWDGFARWSEELSADIPSREICPAKAIIFDFDGVLVESNEIRSEGFRTLLVRNKFPPKAVERLIAFHRANGGLSRYYKIRYFFEQILRRQISDERLNELCAEFSAIVKKGVTEAPWVKGALEFLKENFSRLPCFIVSGSDQSELREICYARRIDGFFKDILGSPLEKEKNLEQLLRTHGLDREKTLFVGDSVNDWKAAETVKIRFVLRDSGGADEWRGRVPVIRDLSELSLSLDGQARGS